jgi:hypothetical protein
VVLGGLLGVMRRLEVMAVSRVRVMRGLFMVAALVMLAGFPVVPGSMFVVFGGLMVMLAGGFAHFFAASSSAHKPSAQDWRS